MDSPLTMLRDGFDYLVSRWQDERSEASRAFDAEMGVETARWTLSGYEPTTLDTLADVLDASPLPEIGSTFIDVGAGKGRVLIVAARRPFAGVLGIEIDPALVACAKQNLRIAVDPERRCPRVEILEADAAQVAWPLGPLVLYLYNPVPADVLYVMLADVEASLGAHPRPCALAYVNPMFEGILADRHWRPQAEGGEGTERWRWFIPPSSGSDHP